MVEFTTQWFHSCLLLSVQLQSFVSLKSSISGNKYRLWVGNMLVILLPCPANLCAGVIFRVESQSISWWTTPISFWIIVIVFVIIIIIMQLLHRKLRSYFQLFQYKRTVSNGRPILSRIFNRWLRHQNRPTYSALCQVRSIDSLDSFRHTKRITESAD